MNLDWVKHLPVSEQDEFKKVVLNSTLVLGRLKTIVEGYEQELDRLELKMDVYDTPSWSHKQAHINGRRQELLRIKQLLTL